MEVLDRGDMDNVISWMPHGRAFLVKEPKVFAVVMLPQYFKQSKFMSFTRQLNLWGFKRITRGPDAGAYYHELFLRNRPRLSLWMRRQKIKGTGIKLTPNPDAEPYLYDISKTRPLPPTKRPQITEPLLSLARTVGSSSSQPPIVPSNIFKAQTDVVTSGAAGLSKVAVNFSSWTSMMPPRPPTPPRSKPRDGSGSITLTDPIVAAAIGRAKAAKDANRQSLLPFRPVCDKENKDQDHRVEKERIAMVEWEARKMMSEQQQRNAMIDRAALERHTSERSTIERASASVGAIAAQVNLLPSMALQSQLQQVSFQHHFQQPNPLQAMVNQIVSESMLPQVSTAAPAAAALNGFNDTQHHFLEVARVLDQPAVQAALSQQTHQQIALPQTIQHRDQPNNPLTALLQQLASLTPPMNPAGQNTFAVSNPLRDQLIGSNVPGLQAAGLAHLARLPDLLGPTQPNPSCTSLLPPGCGGNANDIITVAVALAAADQQAKQQQEAHQQAAVAQQIAAALLGSARTGSSAATSMPTSAALLLGAMRDIGNTSASSNPFLNPTALFSLLGSSSTNEALSQKPGLPPQDISGLIAQPQPHGTFPFH